MKKTILISFVILLTVAVLATATPTTTHQVKKAVKGWIIRTKARPLGTPLGQVITRVDSFADGKGEVIYYIVYLQPSGFVIVPADDLVEPVVGFVASNAYYDPSPENPLGALVSRDMASRVDIARKVQAKWDAGVQKKDLTEEEAVREDKAVKAKGKWSKFQEYADSGTVMSLPGVSDVRVAPLVQSKWYQLNVCDSNCYNYYTPNNFPCGCVATAMAQLMRYWQWPTAGIGVNPFTIYVDDNSQTAYTRGGDDSGGPYNWSQMVPVPDCNITDTQRQAIGALCYDAGVAAHMDYASGGSGAYMHDAKAALVGTFYYTNAVMGGNESTNIGSGLNGMINPNLDAGLPALLGILRYENGNPIGHAVVADGYGYNTSTLYHHLNMGWSGLSDAWYNLPNIDSSPYSYTSVSACVYNIYVSGSGEIISGRVTDSSGNPISDTTVTATGPGGPYTATSNSNGIYALVNVYSNTTYMISVTASGYSFTSQNVTTGTSSDGQFTSGNKSGVDFVSVRAGKIIGWGLNGFGQCDVPSPNTGFVAVEAGTGNRSLGLKADGSIVAWGCHEFDLCYVPSPNSGFVAVSAGHWHSLGLKANGSIVAWGNNSLGQCSVPSPNTGFVAIAAGGYHSLGLKQDGSIVAWGYNDLGQCNVPSPNSGFVAISGGYLHSLGLKQDGSIVAWGDNSYGQCSVPSPNTGFVTIAAGGLHSLGLKTDGSIVTWGWNQYGQCNVPSPNSGFIAVAASVDHSLGLKQDGSIVAWGDNSLGQCSVPSPNTGFVAIAAGWNHSLAIKSPPVADLNADYHVDFLDFSLFAQHWLETGCDSNWCEGTDFDHSGSVDMLDLATFARYWLEGI